MKPRFLMKTFILLVLVGLVFQPGIGALQSEAAEENQSNEIASPILQAASGMPGWPMPDKPIPHHEPGHLSNASSYTSQVERMDEEGLMEIVPLSGLDAMAVDGLDPLVGNYNLVNLDQIMMSWNQNNQQSVQAFTSTLDIMPGSQTYFDNIRSMDIAAGDLNNDGQSEQIVTWIDSTTLSITMSIGEMPGSLGRTTSTPAAVVHMDGSIDLLVRGYDEALWHRRFDGSAWGGWSNDAGGTCLSAPAVASLGEGQFDVFVIGMDNQVYRRHWEGGWSDDWEQYGDWSYAPTSWTGSTPELPPISVLARNGGFDLFRLGPDNTLFWHDGLSWQSLGGMLASAPGAVSLGADHMQVFARGVDEALWYLSHSSGSWGAWQRLELHGMEEGVTIASAPTVVSNAPSQIEVYVRGSDNQLWKLLYDSSTWGGWVSLGGSLASGVAVADGTIFAQADDGSLQQGDGAVWSPLGSLSPCCQVISTTLQAVLIDESPFEYYSLDVETGYFLGDGRAQIALAYEAPSGIVKVTLFQPVGGFIPHLVAEVEIPHEVDWFRITTGDYLDGDGVDEVALAYVHGTSFTVDIVRLLSTGSEVAIEGTPQTDDTLCTAIGNAMEFAGTLEVASGDLDADGLDEIAMALLFACVNSTEYDSYYLYHARTRLYDVSGSNVLSTYSIDAFWDGDGYVLGEVAVWRVGIAIAVGDVDGDGRDELIRTWPQRFGDGNDQFLRYVQVYKLPSITWPVGGAQLDATKIYEKSTLDYDSNSYVDRLAVGDLDRDLKAELVWLIGKDDGRVLSTYDYVVPEEGDPSWDIASKTLDNLWYPKLVTGDFTGESLRVGSPNYRLQNRVDSLVAVINMPPKHRDYVKVDDGDGNYHYELFEVLTEPCVPSATDPLCTHAKHAISHEESSETKLTTQNDWAIGGGLDGKLGFPAGGFIDLSLKYSYGDNFKESEGTITSSTFTDSASAYTHDKIVYFGTPYQIWEYPIFAAGTEEPVDYMTVIFPVPDYIGGQQITRSADTTTGDYPASPWFQAGHQTYNVWSYPIIGDVEFPDYYLDGQILSKVISGGGGGFAFSEGVTSVFQTISEKTHDISAEVGGGYETSKKITEGTGWSAKIRSYVKGSYHHGEINTESQTTSDKTEISGWIHEQPINAQFSTRLIGYWARDGYLVLDYQTDVPLLGKWSELYQDPDPAFILPWYGFPYGDNPVEPVSGLKLYSPEIQVVPGSVSVGEVVTITATVRNFSNHPAQDVTVRLCARDPGLACQPPDGAAFISELVISDLRRENGPVTVSYQWAALGEGEQRIYAVIDPENTINPEVHDEDDLINNNVAYGLVNIGTVNVLEPGLVSERAYQALSYQPRPSMILTAYVPPGNLSEVVVMELQDASLAVPNTVSKPFELVAHAPEGMREKPVYDYSLKPGDGYPPAIMLLSYGDNDIMGKDEGNLMLYRLGIFGWEVATCSNYDIQRFPQDNLLAVPICQTGTFVLADEKPRTGVYLPLMVRN